MDETLTSAPGKLFLFGEYGVLAGGSCVVGAVDRRVRARRRANPGRYLVEGARPKDPRALPEAVLAELDERRAEECTVDRLSTDVRELYEAADDETRDKLGLGSSAASAVALTAACLFEPGHALDEGDRASVFEAAFRAHRSLQQGRGSGADVAAATFGGLIGFRLEAPAEPFDGCALQSELEADLELADVKVATRLTLPGDVRFEAVWLGEPARSTSFVDRCASAVRAQKRPTCEALAHTGALADRALEALSANRGDQLIELVDEADSALERLGRLIEAPIVTGLQRQLRALANPYGLSVKPSGAGGGDFSLVAGPKDAPWPRFLGELPSQLRHVELEFGAPGVGVENNEIERLEH